MSRHAFERINERYGNRFTMEDINNLCAIIKKGCYLEIVKDFVDRSKITILVRYNNIPLKLVYAPKQKTIVTALPLDVDEFNQYYDLVPNIHSIAPKDETSAEEALRLRAKFINGHRNKEINNGFKLETVIKDDVTFYAKNMSERFVIVWYKETNTINYQLYSRKALQKRLWHLVIKGFRERDSKLLTNTALLYAKVFK